MTTLAPKSKPNSSKTILPPFFGVSTRQPPSHRFLGFARRLALRTRVPFRLLAYGVAHLNDGGSNRNDNSQHLYKRTHIVLRFWLNNPSSPPHQVPWFCPQTRFADFVSDVLSDLFFIIGLFLILIFHFLWPAVVSDRTRVKPVEAFHLRYSSLSSAVPNTTSACPARRVSALLRARR